MVFDFIQLRVSFEQRVALRQLLSCNVLQNNFFIFFKKRYCNWIFFM